MDGFGAYKTYLALKLHFSSDSYDYFKFKGEIKANFATFEKRNDKYFFHRLSKKYNKDEFEKILVSNFLKKPNVWIGEILSEESNKTYLAWQKKIQSLSYSFKEEMGKLLEFYSNLGKDFNWIFVCEDSQHPPLLRLTLQKEISLESFIILDRILNFSRKWDKDLGEEIIWCEHKKKCLKYSPFLSNINISNYKKMLKDIVL